MVSQAGGRGQVKKGFRARGLGSEGGEKACSGKPGCCRRERARPPQARGEAEKGVSK